MNGQDRDRLRRGRVRILDGERGAGRRQFLQVVAVQGASLPAATILLGASRAQSAPRVGESAILARQKGALRQPVTRGEDASTATIVRDFADPYLELIRLLREAAELEHSLLVQYLYAVLSLKPAYERVAGYGDPNAHDLLGVAIQEMQHLGAVNRLLVELGASPHLERQDFPYEADIYPFPFNLEPLSRHTLAKYVYTEAPADALQFRSAKTEEDFVFLQDLHAALDLGVRPNHLGSVYGVLIEVLNELGARPADHPLPDIAAWAEELERIRGEGEVDHFNFFRSLFTGQHEGFNGHPRIWSLSADDPAYPAYHLPVNPTGYVGHKNQVQDPAALGLAWLGNLHYWSVLSLLDVAYRDGTGDELAMAQSCMVGPLWSLGKHLPTLGVGLPFDPLSMGYAPGQDVKASLRFISHLAGEADRLAHSLVQHLPSDYPLDFGRGMIAEIKDRMKT